MITDRSARQFSVLRCSCRRKNIWARVRGRIEAFKNYAKSEIAFLNKQGANHPFPPRLNVTKTILLITVCFVNYFRVQQNNKRECVRIYCAEEGRFGLCHIFKDYLTFPVLQ